MSSENSIGFQIPMSIRKKISTLTKKYYSRINFPSEFEFGFDGLIGMDNEKETLKDAVNFFKDIEVYQQNPVLMPHTRYLLAGEPGSGKTPLINALSKEANVPVITVNTSVFNSVSKKSMQTRIIDLIFEIASYFEKGCIVHFKDMSDCTAYDGLFNNHLASAIKQSTNTVVFFSTVMESFKLTTAFLSDNMFNTKKVIKIMPPTLKTREQLFEAYFKKFEIKVSNDVTINSLARNTLGMYPKDIEYIVRETMLFAIRKGTTTVTAKDFNEILLTIEAGEEYNKLSEKERISTAYHEAGHVIAAYYSNPEYILGRVEITPRSRSLGLTKEEAGEEKNCFFYHDFKNEVIYSFGGMAAEKVIYGETSSGTASDLATANAYVTSMIQMFGMSEELGPVVFDDAIGFCSEKFIADSEVIMQKLLKDWQQETIDIIIKNRDKLEALTKALLEHEVLLGDEIKAILGDNNLS